VMSTRTMARAQRGLISRRLYHIPATARLPGLKGPMRQLKA
jgi:hypothetical protein